MKFTSILHAVNYLNCQGYKVSKSKLYRDAAKGLIIRDPGGSVSLASVMKYVEISTLQGPIEKNLLSADQLESGWCD